MSQDPADDCDEPCAKIIPFKRETSAQESPVAIDTCTGTRHTIPGYLDFLEYPNDGKEPIISAVESRLLREIFINSNLPDLVPKVSTEMIKTVRMEMTEAREGSPYEVAIQEEKLWDYGRHSMIPEFDCMTNHARFLVSEADEENNGVRFLPGTKPLADERMIVPNWLNAGEKFFWVILRIFRYQYDMDHCIAVHKPEDSLLRKQTPRLDEAPPEPKEKYIPRFLNLSAYYKVLLHTKELSPTEMMLMIQALSPLNSCMNAVGPDAIRMVMTELGEMEHSEIREKEIAVWEGVSDRIAGFNIRRQYRTFDRPGNTIEFDECPLLWTIKEQTEQMDPSKFAAEMFFWLILRMHRFQWLSDHPVTPSIKKPNFSPLSAPTPTIVPTKTKTWWQRLIDWIRD